MANFVSYLDNNLITEEVTSYIFCGQVGYINEALLKNKR
jgi:hypothetical protein